MIITLVEHAKEIKQVFIDLAADLCVVKCESITPYVAQFLDLSLVLNESRGVSISPYVKPTARQVVLHPESLHPLGSTGAGRWLRLVECIAIPRTVLGLRSSGT